MSGPEWLTGATRIVSTAGGTLVGGPPRWVWHTFEANPRRLSAVAGARVLHAAGNDVHFVFNPLTGDIAQMLPASVSGRALKNAPGGVETNRMGSACIQVEVIGFASQPFTGILTPAGQGGLGRLIRFARAHGIPDVWPAGPPPAYPDGYSVRSAGTWTRHAGHYGHSQVPENNHGDPGALNVRALFASAPATPPIHHPTKGAAAMIIIFTPINGAFLQTSIGRTSIDTDFAVRLRDAGFPSISIGAADTTALYEVVSAIMSAAEQEVAKTVSAETPETVSGE